MKTRAQIQLAAARAAGNRRRSQLCSVALVRQLIGLLPDLRTEYAFCIGRRWRFDVASPSRMIAVEIEGGAFTAGRHTRGKGFVGDIEKYNEAAALGWVVLRALPEWVGKAKLRRWIEMVVRERELVRPIITITDLRPS